MDRRIVQVNKPKASKHQMASGGVVDVGETLPLFDGPTKLAQRRKSAATQRSGRNPANTPGDRHMHAAWELSKALKAIKRGRKAGPDLAGMTPNQRHQVGNVICEHLLASLRQQVMAEEQISKH